MTSESERSPAILLLPLQGARARLEEGVVRLWSSLKTTASSLAS
jgi:hypothetical protein